MIRDSVRRDRPMKILQSYLSEAIEKVRQGDADEVSAVLSKIMPDVLRTLHALAISDDATTAQRKWALEALLAMFSKLMALRLRDQKVEVARDKSIVKRAAAKAELARTKLDDKQAALKLAAAQRKIGRRLEAAEKSIGGQLEETD